jgi:iron complex transport system ATP-binding protein
LILRAAQLSVAMGARALVSDLDLRVEAGEIWAVLGCNGSGKSTLLHALAGLAPAQSGSVEIAGQPLTAYARRDLGRTVGVLLQREDAEFWGSLAAYVALGRYPHGGAWFGASADDEEIVLSALAAFELDALAAQSFSTLSGGERQRARLAQLWAQRPSLLLLDEPLQHLDLRHQLRTLELVRRAVAETGRAALVVLHDLAYATRCDKVLLLYGNGRYEAGNAAELLQPERLESLYGCAIRQFGTGTDAHFMPVI